MLNKRFIFGMTIAAGMLFSPRPAPAELYKWLDGKGRENYTNDLTRIPQEYRANAQVVGAAQDKPSEDRKEEPAPVKKDRAVQAGQPHVDNEGRSEGWWRERADNLRKQIRTEDDNIAYYKEKRRECEEKQKNYVGIKTDCSQLYAESQKQTEWKRENLRKRLEDDLPDEARKAGAYPGWVRE
ncbi:MAG: DUF4124 domain-containing protein [Nitrospiraceae bacterium]|nr:DUF4124 domain-containing protein [Nitrospiraceae bacterium]